MKQKQIKFFSQEDNTIEKKKAAKEEAVVPYAHITSNGKLTLPLITLQFLGVDTAGGTRLKVGIDRNKKGFVGLYLVPIQSADEPSFELTRIGRGYSLLLKGVFLKLGLDFKNTYYRFVLKPVDLDGVGEGFFAKLTEQSVRKDSEEDGE